MPDPNMVRLTTEAVVLEMADRFGYIIPECQVNRDVMFMPDELALRTRAERKQKGKITNIDGKEEPTDKYDLEFMNVWLYDLRFAWDRQRTAVARAGIATEFAEQVPGDRTAVKMFKGMPVDMEFGVTFWTKYKERMDSFIEEFMFWQQNNALIELMYDENKKLQLQIAIDPAVTMDDTKIANMYREGKYWKHTFRFNVASWLLRGVAIKTLKKIILDMYTTAEFTTPQPANANANVYHGVIEESLLDIALLVGDASAPNVHERAVKSFLTGKGHSVTYLSTIDLATANNYDVVVIGYEHAATNLAAIKPTVAGLVLMGNNTSLGFGDTTKATVASNNITITDNKHYITTDYGLGDNEVSDSETASILGYEQFKGMEAELGSKVLGACNTGKEMRDGSLATSRRVMMGLWQFDDANEYGEILFNRAVRWAGEIEHVEEVVP